LLFEKLKIHPALRARAAERCAFFAGRRAVPAARGSAPPAWRSFPLQALLQRIHQADDVIRLLRGFGDLDRLARGLALDQRLQGVFRIRP